MSMRSVLVIILVLASCFLAARMLWPVEAAAPLRAAVMEQAATAERGASAPVETNSELVRPQASLQLFASKPSRTATDAARLPRVAPDLSHVHEFEFDAAALRQLASGDTVSIDFLPLGGRYELNVDEVVDSADERTIRGHIDYDHRQYPSLITITGGWSFGSFATPEGNFEFTARQGMARMVDGAELERRAYAPNHTLIPRRS